MSTRVEFNNFTLEEIPEGDLLRFVTSKTVLGILSKAKSIIGLGYDKTNGWYIEFESEREVERFMKNFADKVESVPEEDLSYQPSYRTRDTKTDRTRYSPPPRGFGSSRQPTKYDMKKPQTKVGLYEMNPELLKQVKNYIYHQIGIPSKLKTIYKSLNWTHPRKNLENMRRMNLAFISEFASPLADKVLSAPTYVCYEPSSASFSLWFMKMEDYTQFIKWNQLDFLTGVKGVATKIGDFISKYST